MTADRIAFLRAQLDTDEQAAQAVGPRSWYFDMIEDEAAPFVDLALNADRVLRQVQAHRAILDRYELSLSHPTSQVSSFVRGQDHGFREGLEEAVKALLSIYSDRDGYRAEWSA